MAEPDFSLMIEHFKRIHEDNANIKASLATLIQRVNALTTHQAGFHVTDAAQDVSIAELSLRVERIERRLQLHDEA